MKLRHRTATCYAALKVCDTWYVMNLYMKVSIAISHRLDETERTDQITAIVTTISRRQRQRHTDTRDRSLHRAT